MLDLQLLRNQLDDVTRRLADRPFVLDAARFRALEEERKTLQSDTQALQARRNELAKRIGQAKGKGEDASALMAESKSLNDALVGGEQRLASLQEELRAFVEVIPNLPHASVPVGRGEQDNVELRRVGTPRRFDFQVKDHVDLGAGLFLAAIHARRKHLGIIDNEDILVVKILHDITEVSVFKLSGVAVNHHHSAFFSFFTGMLSDQV